MPLLLVLLTFSLVTNWEITLVFQLVTGTFSSQVLSFLYLISDFQEKMLSLWFHQHNETTKPIKTKLIKLVLAYFTDYSTD